eukprot:CAMPEP_0197824736 /NCGR_PEP_ID=MMETSP1437-20131217/1954_1 /TAXON_ID=49252 ORGANISM="Eucampia antarctica, Strain CCMP1452" /NCGR_SAMPLE_ID=MMETSP1437 /ASSEMBLY_ACC=CAM_ASM_001096 /LENGTH=299 /DNA_ID=CAMNT_0043424485 /DNA_START=167 /DNA_END=1066 /DNA_ORIENTATION=+
MINQKILSAQKVLPAPRPHWVGDGFKVFPVLQSVAFTNEVSPWLMFDYAAPKKFPPSSQQLGVGQHPHRGFETITMAFQGEVEHADSVGNRDVIGVGDVQWMTAGRGIIHEEFHSRKFAATGGTFEFCQLWLNLPAKDKMHPPKYQAILSKDIPVVRLSEKEYGPSARIIAGSLHGKVGPAETFTPVDLWDIIIPKDEESIELSLPNGHNTIIFVRRGGILLGNKKLGPQDTIILKPEINGSGENNILKLTSTTKDTSVILMGGEPINEPIAARGPFVMNTQEELRQAGNDFRTGKMGR